MDRKIKLKTEIDNKDLDETGEKFTKLQLQIRAVNIELQKAAEAGDTVKFNQLRKELDDLEEGLEKVQFQSKQFDDQLSAMPGPAGKAGQAIKSVDSAFKMLIANPIIGIIAGIAAALMAMYKALQSTSEGQATLNKLTSSFDKILAPILALIEKVAVPVFNAFADAVAWVGDKFEKLVVWLGISEKKIKEAYGNINEEEKKRLEEQAKKAEEARKKAEETAAKNLETLKQGVEDARKVLMQDREREVYEVQQKYKKLYDLHNANKKELVILKKAEAKELADITKKYTDEEIKVTEEFTKKLGEISTAAIKDELARKAIEREQKYQDDLRQLERDKEFIKLDEETKNFYRAQLRQGFENDLLNMKKDFADKEIEINKQITQSYIDLANSLSDIFGRTAELFAEGSKASKIFGTLSVITNAAAAIGTAIMKNKEAQASYDKTIAEGKAGLYSAGIMLANPLTAVLGGIQAAASKAAIAGATAGKIKSKVSTGIQIGAILAASAGQIAAINSSKLSSAGTGGGESANAPSVTNVGQGALPAPVIGSSMANPSAQLATMVGNSVGNNISNKPIKTYVLNQDIKTADQFDRRILAASKLG